LENVTG